MFQHEVRRRLLKSAEAIDGVNTVLRQSAKLKDKGGGYIVQLLGGLRCTAELMSAATKLPARWNIGTHPRWSTTLRRNLPTEGNGIYPSMVRRKKTTGVNECHRIDRHYVRVHRL